MLSYFQNKDIFKYVSFKFKGIILKFQSSHVIQMQVCECFEQVISFFKFSNWQFAILCRELLHEVSEANL